MIQRWRFGSTPDGWFLPCSREALQQRTGTVPPCPLEGWGRPPPAPAWHSRVGQVWWQWLGPQARGLVLNILVIRVQGIFCHLHGIIAPFKFEFSTFYFKMTLQVLLCDTHFNSTLILHNSHMIQCVCFMRQTWHMKIKNRFLVWNTERNRRGKKKKTMRMRAQRSGWREKGRKKQDETSESFHPAQSENSFHQYERQFICINLLQNKLNCAAAFQDWHWK